jgi:chemotaxis-related protein WspD
MHRDDDTRHAALAFRVADEWLALPIGALREIVGTRPIHSLPHRRHSAVRGVVNIRGTLRIAISPARCSAWTPADLRARRRRRLHALAGGRAPRRAGGVSGGRSRGRAALRCIRMGARAGDGRPRGRRPVARRAVVARQSVGLLDDDRLFDAVTRSMR